MWWGTAIEAPDDGLLVLVGPAGVDHTVVSLTDAADTDAVDRYGSVIAAAGAAYGDGRGND